MYSLPVILTLVGMITMGAARIVAIKIYYQIELEESRPVTPLFVTLLYLTGQTLSLVVHYVYQYIRCDACVASIGVSGSGSSGSKAHPATTASRGYDTIETAVRKLDGDNDVDIDIEYDIDGSDEDASALGFEPMEPAAKPPADGSNANTNTNTNTNATNNTHTHTHTHTAKHPPRRKARARRRGSKTGLTEESEAAVAWIHRIPWYCKPVIPGLFNLCNSALRWACLVYVAASTAEILISGLELVLSSLAARVLRKRAISKQRWTGVAIITAGILLVGSSSNNNSGNDETHDFVIGNVLIAGQCVFSVLQDLSEEIFLQEADFPATLLLGMEGLFGLAFGLPITLVWFADELDVARSHIAYESGLVLLVLVTGILNIRTTEVTSSMTRNVWKQFRIMLVWILALLVYYLGTNTRFGEPWVDPDSWFVLGGFSVVLTGLLFYYSG
eukprot:jgi/Psemu1/260807/estExt_Genewise1Plus.C_4970009